MMVRSGGRRCSLMAPDKSDFRQIEKFECLNNLEVSNGQIWFVERLATRSAEVMQAHVASFPWLCQ